MECYEYVRITCKQIPQTIIDYYKLEPKFNNDVVYAEVHKGMYGLKQAGCLKTTN